MVQVMLNGILRSFPLSKLAQLPEIRGVVDALLPYTERHFQRLEDSVQRTYFIDFVLHSTSAVGEDGDEDENESGPLPFVIDVGKKAAQNYHAQIHEVNEDDEKAASEGNDSEDAGDGDADMAGWGDWGGNGSDDGEGAESEDEAPNAHKSAASVGKDSQKRSNRAQDDNLKSGSKAKKKMASQVEEDSGANLTPAPKKAATASKSTGKKKKAEEPAEDEESQAAATPIRTQERPAAKTTGKKKKPAASEDTADPIKRRKSLDSSQAKGTPPVAKRLRAKA